MTKRRGPRAPPQYRLRLHRPRGKITLRMGVYRAQLVSWFMSTTAIVFRFNMIQRTYRQLSLRIHPCVLLPVTSPTSTSAQADSHHRSHHTSQSSCHTFPELQLLELSATSLLRLRLCFLLGMLLSARTSLLLATTPSPRTFPRRTAGLQLLELSASAVLCLRLCGLGGMLLATRLSLLLATTSADRPSDRPFDHRPSTIDHRPSCTSR